MQDDGTFEKECIIMEEKIVLILNEMSEYLSIAQRKSSGSDIENICRK